MYFRARNYNPLTGEFLSRDPLGFVDGMSLNRGYFGLKLTDPHGLWVEVDYLSLWRSDDENDTFEGLVDLLERGLTNLNRSCIQPVPIDAATGTYIGKELEAKMRSAWMQKKPARCGVYDVGNLLDVWPTGGEVTASIGIDQVLPGYGISYIHSAADFYGIPSNRRFFRGTELANYIAVTANEGGTPIGRAPYAADPQSESIIIGHSWDNLKSIGGFNAQGGQFSLDDLAARSKGGAVWYWPKFDDAKQRILPPICWFRTSARVRMVGCKSSRFARHFANELLRKTDLGNGGAFGALVPTWAVPGPPLQMGFGKEKNGNVVFDAPDLYDTPASYHKAENRWKFHEANK